MRILLLTRSFNGLTQRLFLEMRSLGHELSLELDISDAVTLEAAALFRPDLVIAPYLQRAIPQNLWRNTPCFVLHPGPPGDRGPSALDWAISEGAREWGVTVLQAVAEYDAGPVWASVGFTMREATKSSLYRQEVTDAAVRAVTQALRRFADGEFPRPPPPGHWRPLMTQAQRRIDWQHDDTQAVLRKIRAGDGVPGVLDECFGVPCHLFDAHAEASVPGPVPGHPPGVFIGRRDAALLRATRDGAVWIGHVKRIDTADQFKLPATLAFAEQSTALSEVAEGSWREIRYEAADGVGTLHFPFYNGAICSSQCQRLNDALRAALAAPEPVLVLAGGPEFWCNGIHLNVIEAADSPADESWRNINAINDVCLTLIEATHKWVIAAMQGNAGAGGAFMALAADEVWAREGVVLNPHYKNMGNLYGSEYWTYLLPRRLDPEAAGQLIAQRLPVAAARAVQIGLIDATFGTSPGLFLREVQARAARIATDAALGQRLRAKQQRRQLDEATKPLATYRAEELARMRHNFYGFDSSYHIARSNFVRRVPHSWTPRHLALHRDGAARRT
jgi:putative two-component system protein, hydrogenase maturation factor HypX/HoxX